MPSYKRYIIEPSGSGGCFYIRNIETGELVMNGLIPLMPSTREDAIREIEFLTRIHPVDVLAAPAHGETLTSEALEIAALRYQAEHGREG